jgi:hypothetical protein
MAAAPVPAAAASAANAAVANAAPATPAMGDLYQTYQGGSPSDLFAPPHIAGYAPSDAAVAAWTQAHYGVTPDMISSLNMPAPWQPPSPKAGSGIGPYGKAGEAQLQYGAGRIPAYQGNLTGAQGLADPAALMAMTQGSTTYDVNARRAAIAAQLQANAQAQDAWDAQQAQQQQAPAMYGGGYGVGA